LTPDENSIVFGVGDGDLAVAPHGHVSGPVHLALGCARIVGGEIALSKNEIGLGIPFGRKRVPNQHPVIEPVAQKKMHTVAGDVGGMIELQGAAGIVEIDAGEHQVGILSGDEPSLNRGSGKTKKKQRNDKTA